MRVLITSFGSLITLLGLVASSANAVTQGELLAQFGSQGSGAGQLKVAQAIATNPVTGHVFVIDRDNSRIDEFTAWGNFVKAFGWDVAPAGVNEQQEATVKATAGQFKLSFGASSTVDLEHDAPASEAEGSGSVEAALNSLPSIAAGGGKVAVTKGPSDGSSSRYVVSFSTGPLKEANVEQLIASSGTVPLSGGTPSSGAVVGTRADGTSGGTGLESCTADSGCKAGNLGGGDGQLSSPRHIAVDAVGDIYVREDRRVQKFDSSGRLILMFGGEVNKTKSAEVGTTAAERNVCAVSSGDECGAGVPGNGPGQFEGGIGVAVGPTNKVFVTDKERIQEFDPDGTYLASIPLSGKTIIEFAVDPTSGDFYATFGFNAPEIGPESEEASLSKLAPSGAELCGLVAPRPGFISTDSAGNVYAAKTHFFTATESILEFDGNCPAAKVSEFALENVGQKITATATNTAGDLLVGRAENGVSAYISLYGPAPVKFEPPPSVPPTISAQYATSVDPEDATVRAEINPHFWTDARYYVEYGTGKCSEGGCEHVQPIPSGALLTSKVTGDPVTSGGAVLQDLEPSATYHYRFVAKSGGGGPVYGIDPDGQDPKEADPQDGQEATFRTFAQPQPSKSNCPNQAFRTGPSASLPDCRAYEMVSPIDKDGADVQPTQNSLHFTDALVQSSLDGSKLTYSSSRAFGAASGAPLPTQFISSRGAQGWSTTPISPQRQRVGGNGDLFENEYQGFTPDLASAWLFATAESPLVAGPPEGSSVLYHRDNGSDVYQALAYTPTKANGVVEDKLSLEGFTSDGSKALIAQYPRTSTLEGNAQRLYYADEAGLHLVCVLPSGLPSGEDCSAGSPPGGAGGGLPLLLGRFTHAISADGTRVYWSESQKASGKLGKLYVRLNPGQPQSSLDPEGHCEDPSAACTLQVTNKSAQFWAASPDGSRAIYAPTEGAKAGNLEEFDLADGTTSLVAKKTIGVAGQSEDLSYIYFVSEEVLGGFSSEGKVPVAGQPNLYLHHNGSDDFIATLAPADVRNIGNGDGGAASNTAPAPAVHAARATSSGQRLAFISTASITGYDNLDASTGKPDFEVYTYDADGAQLDCASCNPSGARPRGQELNFFANLGNIDAAAVLPTAYSALAAPRVMSANGSRLFFNSYDALLPADTNGTEDVYEWQVPGSGDCSEVSTSYGPANGGCVSLISSGENSADSELIDATPSGSNVFFTTNASLLPQDPGLIDVYDARESGGFPPPLVRSAACEGEACQGPYAPPDDPTPASSSFQGAGNVTESSKGKKGKRKAHHRKPKHAKRAHHDRRAGR